MSDIALFTCKKEEEGKKKGKNLLKYLYRLLIERAKEPDLLESVNHIELFDNVNACILNLPYTISQLESKPAKLANLGSLLKSRYENIMCIVPGKIFGLHSIEGCTRDDFVGKVLFKSLLVQIIDEIYAKRNIEVSALDITIIHGQSYEELYTALIQLSPYVKFLTVITEDKEQVERDTSKIYYDTGLAVRVTNEYRSGMKNADLIINFASSKEFVFNARINPRALIINYGDINFSKVLSDNIIINGIEIGLPQSISSKMGKEVFEYYNKKDLAEIILVHKALLSDEILEGLYNSDIANGLYKVFKKSGFSIAGFQGRRNIIKAKDIKLYGT